MEKWVKIERDTAGCTKGFKDGNNWKGDPKQVGSQKINI